MKRLPILIAAALVSAALVTNAGAAPGPARAAHGATVQLRHTHLGTILVNSSGHTLYVFTRDHPHSNSCVAITSCPSAWPALETSAKPTAGAGVSARMLSTITLHGGAKQVTYAGRPLYLYAGDTGAGETGYVGERQFGGLWDAINASGHLIK